MGDFNFSLLALEGTISWQPFGVKDGESYLCVERNVSLTLFKSNIMPGAKTMEISAQSKSFWSFDMEI